MLCIRKVTKEFYDSLVVSPLYSENVTEQVKTIRCVPLSIDFKGTVVNPGSEGKGEHMASFKYAYRLERVRDWIFEQEKKE